MTRRKDYDNHLERSAELKDAFHQTATVSVQIAVWMLPWLRLVLLLLVDPVDLANKPEMRGRRNPKWVLRFH